MVSTRLRNNTVELVQISVKVEHWSKSILNRKVKLKKKNALLTATHSIISVYLGSMTIVLKFPFTRAASAKGLHK